MKKKKRNRLIVTVLCCTIAAVFLLRPKDESINVECCKVSLGSIRESIPASGRIRPAVEVKISSDVSGEIVELRCKEGDRVRRGDTIIQISQDIYRSIAERAEASLNSMKAQFHRSEAELEKAEQDYNRSTELYGKDAISLAEFEASETAYRIAQENVKAARYTILSGEAQLKEAMENLARTTICAPMSGTVSQLYVEKGERVVGTSQMAGTEMMRIADFSKMELVVFVGENDIVRIARRDTATVEADAWPKATFRGTVTKTANSAKESGPSFENLTNFEVRIEIAPHELKLLPGMSATATIVTTKKENCLTVPIGSVFSRDRKEYVWAVREDNTVEKREITTGIQDFSVIEVLSGLSEEETIVISPLSAITETLKEGKKVKY